MNQYIARDEIEYEVFTKMDEERYEQDSKVYPRFSDPRLSEKKINYRLMGDDEIPEWLVENVSLILFSPKQKKNINNMDEATERGK